MPSLLEAVEFRNPARARTQLEHLSAELRDLFQEQVERMLQSSPDPDGAFDYLVRFAESHPDGARRLLHSMTGLKYLVAVFSYSRFLSEEVLQNPSWIEELITATDLFRIRLPHELHRSIEEFLAGRRGASLASSLALFRRKELLRILIRDVLELATLPEIAEELSNVAATIVHAAYVRIRAALVERHGQAMSGGQDGPPHDTQFSVVALGKLGGRELNYSSDIDLMFVYSENGETEGPVRISNKEFYKKLSNQLTELLSTYTAEGICYRVDLRLRPEGRYGEVCISVEGARQYYSVRARDWELQMLIKARVVAGDPGPGCDLLDAVESRIYSSTLDFSTVESMSEARERISEKLVSRRGGGDPLNFDIKLARGGIRDVEFLVQCLQRLHGGREPWVRHGGTMLALSRLHDKELLSETEYWRLSAAYQFLRDLEHRLQFLDDRQTHTLPSDPAEFELLARRMPSARLGAEHTPEMLRRSVNEHLEEVLEIYERVIHAQKPMYYTPVHNVPAETAKDEDGQFTVPSNLIRFLDQKAPALAALIARRDTRHSAQNLEHFLERALANNQWMHWLNTEMVVSGHLLDLFEHSPYLAEQFIRFPELIEDLRDTVRSPESARDYSVLAGEIQVQDASDLRRFFRSEMTRLQVESVCLHAPIFDTLARTSDLAETVIAASYRMAVHQTLASRPPERAGYEVRDQLMVIALGRLGQREFDLASDADLVFVIPDADQEEQLFWTRVAERAINIITAYTGEGVMFAVDTRLRPNGRAGALVQSVSGCKEYFARSAEAWEGIAYMKSRAVAGDAARATEFLHELQDVDWRRWGQSGRSKRDLREMRARLETEQGPANPLKAGRGGYYDIDFALMYLRLKSAGMFFKVLNTPERIDVIERMGHLDREDAAFLSDAAVFYRSLDHGLRILCGQAEGDLPASDHRLAALTELVTRWTPDHLHDQPIRVELAQIQERTREIFDRLFA